MSTTNTVFVPANNTLTITTDAQTSGNMHQSSPGAANGANVTIAASGDTTIGPFALGRQYTISTTGNPITIAVTPITDTDTNLTLIDDDTMATATATNVGSAESTTAYADGIVGTSTAAELNFNDTTAQAETIDSGVAASVAVLNTKVDNTTSGAGAITLAVPGAEMYGRVKTIEMTVDAGDVTLALTNVTGGTAATTCTFAAVNDALVLLGGTSKWHVIAESGVVLS